MIKIRNEVKVAEPTFEMELKSGLNGEVLVVATRTDINPQDSNTLLIIAKDGTVSRPILGANHKAHFKVDEAGRLKVG